MKLNRIDRIILATLAIIGAYWLGVLSHSALQSALVGEPPWIHPALDMSLEIVYLAYVISTLSFMAVGYADKLSEEQKQRIDEEGAVATQPHSDSRAILRVELALAVIGFVFLSEFPTRAKAFEHWSWLGFTAMIIVFSGTIALLSMAAVQYADKLDRNCGPKSDTRGVVSGSFG